MMNKYHDTLPVERGFYTKTVAKTITRRMPNGLKAFNNTVKFYEDHIYMRPTARIIDKQVRHEHLLNGDLHVVCTIKYEIQ